MLDDVKEVLDRAIALHRSYDLLDLDNGTISGLVAELSAFVGRSKAIYALGEIKQGRTTYLLSEITGS